jgi:hypothetical protein
VCLQLIQLHNSRRKSIGLLDLLLHHEVIIFSLAIIYLEFLMFAFVERYDSPCIILMIKHEKFS